MAVDGKWNISVETPIGTRQATLTLSAAGSALTGTQSADGGSAAEARLQETNATRHSNERQVIGWWNFKRAP